MMRARTHHGRAWQGHGVAHGINDVLDCRNCCPAGIFVSVLVLTSDQRLDSRSVRLNWGLSMFRVVKPRFVSVDLRLVVK